jgi:threonine dehydratase
LFVEVEFPERAGALLGFMNAISWITSVCYFNYAYTGERVGRALIGLDFENDEELSIHRDKIFGQAGKTVRAVKEVLAGEIF